MRRHPVFRVKNDRKGQGNLAMKSEAIRERYPYLYETHLHTSEASACARNTGEEMARACKEYGYTGIIVTDHNWGGNTCVDGSLSWDAWVDQFCLGYEHAKAEGDRIGLDVFFGYEAGYDATEFLVYGIDQAWMKIHPELRHISVEEQYGLVHGAGGLVMHAHPYREEAYIPKVRLFPEWVDGVEGINAAHHWYTGTLRDKTVFDKRAVGYAGEHGFPLSAGSDIHSTNLFGGGMAFCRRLRSGADYVQAVLGGEDYAMTDGKVWYDKYGRCISDD